MTKIRKSEPATDGRRSAGNRDSTCGTWRLNFQRAQLARLLWLWLGCGLMFTATVASAQNTNLVSIGQNLPSPGGSLLRVIGSLALVLALFFGGVWLFRNWQRMAVHRGCAPKLRVLEARSLGARQALYVVAYEEQRFLVAASTTGVNLLTRLPEAEAGDAPPPAAPMPGFAETLRGILTQRT